MEKRCSMCGHVKPVECFGKFKTQKDGIHCWCKECVNQKRRDYYEANRQTEKDKSLSRYHRNADDAEFRERRNARQRTYSKDYIRRPETRLKAKEWHRRYISKIEARISRRVSFQVWYSLRLILDESKKKNQRHWQELVGWSIEQLMAHLESGFQTGMAWSNYGGDSGWQIDHVVPRSWFKIREVGDEAFRKCWALDNLQPKWLKDNASKGNRFAG